MGAQLKEVRNRIQSVKSTQQITKAMKLVSAAKLRRAQDAITMMRPYANKLNEILANMAASLEGDVELDLAAERAPEKVLIIPISSDKGLAGSYNANIIKLTNKLLVEKYAEQVKKNQVTLLPIGKKVKEYFQRRFDKVNDTHASLLQELTFENASSVVNEVTKQFLDGRYDRVEVVYSGFKNAATQLFTAEQFLPVVKPEQTDAAKADFIFEPSREKIIEELVPKILRTTFYKYLLEANASEHGARMTAMDKATDNANELLKDLRLSYNRARQAAITTELAEIVGGAAALAG